MHTVKKSDFKLDLLRKGLQFFIRFSRACFLEGCANYVMIDALIYLTPPNTRNKTDMGKNWLFKLMSYYYESRKVLGNKSCYI